MGVAITVLFATLYFYDDKSRSDVWVLLTWLMLVLSFPAGIIVSGLHMMVGVMFDATIETSYLSLVIEWLIYFLLGYLQWFKILPCLLFVFRRWRAGSYL